MTKFLKFEDNEDGTVTMTTNMIVEGEEICIVIPINMEEMIAAMDVDQAMDFVGRDVMANAVIIPNSPDENSRM